MGTTAEKLIYLNETKTAIRDAIEAQGVEVGEDASFRSYADRIAEIQGGGGSSGGGLMFVTITDGVPSHSYQEIREAFESEIDVALIYPDSDMLILPLVGFDGTDAARFELISQTNRYAYLVYAHGGVADASDMGYGSVLRVWIGSVDESSAYEGSNYVADMASYDKYTIFADGEFSVNGQTVLVRLPYVGVTNDGTLLAHFSVVSSISGEPILYNAVIDEDFNCTKTATPLGYVNGEEVSY